jgi:hypothetical protein
MTRGKKIFAGFALVFLLLLIYASYDIGRRTTFPGSHPQLKQRLEEYYRSPDTLARDSAKHDGHLKK